MRKERNDEVPHRRDEAEKQQVYEVRDGLRFVKPYKHEFKTFAKRRWID